MGPFGNVSTCQFLIAASGWNRYAVTFAACGIAGRLAFRVEV
jgi:hypothetical protein